MSEEIELAKKWAYKYVGMGYNPIPARPIQTKKGGKLRIRPSMLKFTEVREEGIGISILEKWWTPCIQLSLGWKHDLVIVDLDDAKAVEVWGMMCLHREPIRTWKVQHDPHGGMHLWFRNPPGLVLPFATVIWELEGEKHTAIEVLGDRNLIVAPPSVSPRSGLPYAFLPGCGPEDIEEPAMLPDWVVSKVYEKSSKREEERRVISTVRADSRKVEKPVYPSHGMKRLPSYDWEDVLPAIMDKVGLAESWGVRFASRTPNQAGWVRCHSIFREDNNPSAMFGADKGGYWEKDMGQRPMSLFDLMIHRGFATSRYDAIQKLGFQFLGDGYRARSKQANESQSAPRTEAKGA